MTNRNYFKGVWTAEECKERFKELVKELHPDNNPDRDTTRDFQDMNSEFIRVYNELKNVHRRKDDGQTYEETREAKREWNKMSEYDKKSCKRFYVLESENPDEESENHYDGNSVWEA